MTYKNMIRLGAGNPGSKRSSQVSDLSSFSVYFSERQAEGSPEFNFQLEVFWKV